MGQKKVLDVRSDGIIETYQSHADGTFSIQKSQEVGDMLASNQEEKNNASTNWKGELHKVASIPLIIVEQWWKELGSDPFHKKNRKWLIARLNSSDYGKLRTKEGRI